MLFEKVGLSKGEKKVIRRITRVRMNSLKRILCEDTYEDLIMVLLEEGVEKSEFMEKISITLKSQQEIYDHPYKLFSMEEDEIEIAKHIMFNCTDHVKYLEGKRKIWAKFILIERLPIHLN